MLWTSAIAIYLLFWSFCLFLVLPFHARTADEAGESKIPGQADSAPVHFKAWRVVFQVTLLSAFAFGLFYWNYTTNFITTRDIDFFAARTN